MYKTRSIKRQALIWSSGIIIFFGVAAWVTLILYQMYSIRAEFARERSVISSTISGLILRDVAIGNYYNVKNRLFEFSQQHKINGLVYCSSNNEKLILLGPPHDACSLSVGSSFFNNHSFVLVTPVGSGDATFGKLAISYKTDHVIEEVKRAGVSTFLAFVCILTVTVILLCMVINRLLSPIFKHIKWLSTLSQYDNLYHVDSARTNVQFEEEETLNRAFVTILTKYRQLNLQLQEQAVMASLGNLTSQVAHDLRSPLSSMMLAGQLLQGHVGEDPKATEALTLLRLSRNRIETIANDLLAEHHGQPASGSSSGLFSIHEVLDELIGELKSSELGEGVAFEKNYHQSAIYLDGKKSLFSRAMGNVFKNALEAMTQNPVSCPKGLTISTSLDQVKVHILIRDTGCGIPEEKIPLILKGGHTDGKADGHGIGTQVIRDMVDKYDGDLAIQSKVGQGTTFQFSFSTPCDTINQGTIFDLPNPGVSGFVVIDDEPSLREQWRLTLKAQGFDARFYACWEEYERDPSAGDTFIIDYHFDNSEVDGLEIIRRLKERGHTQIILATAEYWKPAIKDAAQKLGARLCPKPLPRVVVAKQTPLLCKEGAGDVETLSHPTSPYPLRGPCVGEEKNSGPNVLVIDDDAGIRMCWKMQRESFGIGDLHMFASMEECENKKLDYGQIDLAFVDKHIEGSEWKLDKLIAHLKQNGVGKVWIASGEATHDLQNDPTCAAADGIVKGKMPQSLEDYSI